ncbi:uncharacterized protein LOC144716287 isoform X2 [Wolffia australiana]
MSRCFPFPPPGYEKKPQSSSLHLLLKKKEKEKELKKEKKDREKKDGRERKDKDRDKERSKDKNREKKSKKEKRRDKDKKKDKEKDKKGKRDEDHRKEDEKNVDLVKPQPKKTDVAAVDVPERRPVLMGQPVVNVPVAVVPSIADDARRTRIADVDRRADEAKDKEKKHKSRDKEEKKKKDKSKEKPRDDGGVTVVTATAADRKSPLGDGALVKRGRNGFFHDEARSHMLSRPELPLVNGLLLEDEARPHKVARSELPLVNGPFDDDVARPQKLLRSELPPANEPVHEDEGRSHKLAWPDFPLVNGLEPNLAQDSLGKPVDFNETGKPTGKQQLPLKVNGQAPPKQAPTVPENGEPARKPSRSLHPREIQLSKLLQIPKLEQGAEPVDQDWLIGRQPATTTGPKLDDEELPKVWAEPVLTGPDGVIALPYVLPF